MVEFPLTTNDVLCYEWKCQVELQIFTDGVSLKGFFMWWKHCEQHYLKGINLIKRQTRKSRYCHRPTSFSFPPKWNTETEESASFVWNVSNVCIITHQQIITTKEKELDKKYFALIKTNYKVVMVSNLKPTHHTQLQAGLTCQSRCSTTFLRCQMIN